MDTRQRQLQCYRDELDFETNSWDTHVAMAQGEPVIVIDESKLKAQGSAVAA
jgi:hypothetical protein